MFCRLTGLSRHFSSLLFLSAGWSLCCIHTSISGQCDYPYQVAKGGFTQKVLCCAMHGKHKACSSIKNTAEKKGNKDNSERLPDCRASIC
ncbi:hypothetical protein V8F33_002072 [Rhypophila sp. PSN 637]